MLKKKIAYVSGTRADFGLMTPILKSIQRSKKLELQVYATGIHLMPEFGRTVREVKKLFPSFKKINAIFKSDDRRGMAEFNGKFLSEAVKAFLEDRPDFVLILGDRPEMLCVAVACLYLGIPTGHIHGGEKAFTVDEVARHAITKLSNLHFAATKQAARRIEMMGEEKWRIHIVGAPALDVILNERLPSRAELFKKIGVNPKEKLILVTQHPVSEEWKEAGKQMEEALAAVKSFDLPAVVIYPHADAGGRKMIAAIQKEKANPNFKIFPSLPYKDFLALEREAAVWAGNSSAGMIEASSFGTPVVNIGTRQLGREHGLGVINVGCDRKEIKSAIRDSLFDRKYRKKLLKTKNPWGDGKSAERVVKILERLPLDKKLLVKQLTYD